MAVTRYKDQYNSKAFTNIQKRKETQKGPNTRTLEMDKIRLTNIFPKEWKMDSISIYTSDSTLAYTTSTKN